MYQNTTMANSRLVDVVHTYSCDNCASTINKPIYAIIHNEQVEVCGLVCMNRLQVVWDKTGFVKRVWTKIVRRFFFKRTHAAKIELMS